MPRSVKDIRELVTLAARKDVKSAIIKKNGKTETKFKLRGARFVYSLSVNNPKMAEKIVSSFPPGLTVTEIKSKKPKKERS